MMLETIAQNFHEHLTSQDWQTILSDACNGIKSQINPDCAFKSALSLLLSAIVYNPRQTLQYLLNTGHFIFTFKKFLQYRKTLIAQSYLRKVAINAFIEVLRYIRLLQQAPSQISGELEKFSFPGFFRFLVHLLEYHRVAEGAKAGLLTADQYVLERHIKRNLLELSFLPLSEVVSRNDMAADVETFADSDEDSYIDQYGNDEAAMSGDNAHDFHEYNLLIEKLQSPLKLEDNDEF